MKKRTGIIVILIAVLALGIGYAAMSGVTLNVEGQGTISVDDSNFKVKFQEPATTSGDGTIVASVTDDLTAEFTVSDFTKAGDSATIVYTIKNESVGIAADLVAPYIENSNEDDFTVTATLSSNNIAADGTATLTVVITSLKTPTRNDLETLVTVSVEANPAA